MYMRSKAQQKAFIEIKLKKKLDLLHNRSLNTHTCAIKLYRGKKYI
jgi:hypothetical protein